MTTPAFTLFDTPIGRCGIAWGPRGIVGLQLPESGERATRLRLAQRFPGAREEEAPPASIKRAVAAIGKLLDGKTVDLSTIDLDMEGVPPFHRQVYEAARTVAPGTTLTYGAMATRIGAPGSARAVGQALGKNPFPIVVPCHRVLAAGGQIGGFSAPQGLAMKRRLLSLEGA